MIKNVAISSVLLGGLLLLLEVGARLFLPFPTSTQGTYAALPNQLVFHKPYSRGYELSPVGEFPANLVKYGKLGFRGDWESRLEHRPLIAVLGDSFIEGRQVPEEHTTVGILNSRHFNYFFLNAGCSAHTSTHYFAIARDLVLPLRPKLLLVLLTFNDYRDNFVYQGGFYLRPEIFKSVDVIFPPSPPKPVSYLDRIIRLSALLENVLHFSRGLYPSNITPQPHQGTFHENMFAVNTPDTELSELDIKTRDFTHRGLKELNQFARAQGVEVAFFINPIPTQVSAKEWRSGKKMGYGLAEDYFDPSTVYQKRLLNYCKSEGLTCVDLLPKFREASRHARLYFEFDGHWTSDGNNVAANELAKWITQWSASK